MGDLFQDVIAADEKDWRAHVALAQLAATRGETDRAFKLLFDAVRINPHALAVHLEIWKVLVEDENRAERIQHYLEEVAESAFFLDPYVCMKCAYRTNGILWRCPHCQEWNTFLEERVETVDR